MAGETPKTDDPSRHELVRKAAELAAAFRERAAETDRARILPEESIRELEASGLLASLVPREHGGLELDLPTYGRVIAALGEGCTSTAWVAAFYMMHGWFAALFPREARAELFGGAEGLRAPLLLSPGGKASAEGDGFRVSGRWPFGTGVAHAHWVLLSAIVETGKTEPGAAPDMRMFALPVEDVRVEETWFTDGMRGTASHDIVVDDVVVPGHRALSLADQREGRAPGSLDHANPLYRLPTPPLFALTAAAPAVGTARAAVEVFQGRVESHRMYMSSTRQREKPAAQMRLARADVDARAAALLLEDVATKLSRHVGGATQPTIEERAEIRMQASRAVDLSRGAVRLVCEAAGAGAHFENHPLQRMHRDLETLACHALFDFDSTAELAGRVMLGMEPGHPLV